MSPNSFKFIVVSEVTCDIDCMPIEIDSSNERSLFYCQTYITFFLLTNFNNSRRFRGPFKSISSSVEICETYLFGDFRCLDILSNGRRNCSHLSNLSLCTWVARNNGSGWISKHCPFLLKYKEFKY